MIIPNIDQSISLEVQNRIDNRVSDLFIQTDDNKCKPYVCILCDIFVKPKEVQFLSIENLLKHSFILKNNPSLNVSESLKACYTIKNFEQLNINRDTKQQIQDLILSPRSTYIKKSNRNKGFVICQSCKLFYCKGEIPQFSIANNFFFGTPPEYLTRLTQVEVAMITPVKIFGYCFSYTSGIQKQLKGSLSYYKVKFESIVRSALHFEALGLTNTVVVLLYGRFTQEQYNKAKKKQNTSRLYS